jgi:hypothetical protein
MGEGKGRKEDVLRSLQNLYFRLLDKTDAPRYWCIHQFCRVFARFVNADQIVVLQECEDGWEIICSIRESEVDRNTAKEEEINKKVRENLPACLERITWLPGEMDKKRIDLEKIDDGCVIPVWRDVGYTIRRYLVVLARPRLIDLEDGVETPTPKVPLTIGKQFYHAIYYWLTKGFYERKVQSHICLEAIRGRVGLRALNASISKPKGGLINKPFGWPTEFGVISELFRACWFAYLAIARDREAVGAPEIKEGEAFWERGSGMRAGEGDKGFWEEYMEPCTQEKLCHPKASCGNPICREQDKEKSRLLSEMCKFVKWPLLFEEGRYDYLKTPAGGKKEEQAWLGRKFDEMASFTQSWGFVGKECIGDGTARKRPSVLFC